MDRLTRISIVIPTRDRPGGLSNLLSACLGQTYPPFEVVIVDDSPSGSAKTVFEAFSLKLKSLASTPKYVQGNSNGLTDSRNLGIGACRGDVILFLDDDTTLDQNALKTLAAFFGQNTSAIAVQPELIFSKDTPDSFPFLEKMENAVHKALMLSYKKENTLVVRRSGMSVFPTRLTRPIFTQRLFGCCSYRRGVFDKMLFDTNLKRWGFMEDLDFSFRLYKMQPRSLYAVPGAKIFHQASSQARLPRRIAIRMTVIHWFYVFFKDVYESSLLNLFAFFWALAGNLIVDLIGLIIRKKPKKEWYRVIWLVSSYLLAFRNLGKVLMGKMGFFNENLVNQGAK